MSASVKSIIDANLTAIYDLTQTAVSNQTDPETYRLITTLVFAERKSIRTSAIILAAFNIIAAATTATSILYDCYWASKGYNSKFRASKFCISSIHPAETFPLALSIGTIVQGLVFAVVQGEGLKALYIRGCDIIAQVLWPAIFIVPYIQLVFGLECVFRSFRSLPFQARGKYDVTICFGIILLMLFATWLPSHIFVEPNICYASLLSFIPGPGFGELGSIILTSSACLMLISSLIVFYRLSTVNLIDQHQRIAASRIVHYLIIGILSIVFTLPHFFSLLHSDGNLKLSMMATIALNLSGLTNGLLHLVLRSNTSTTSFGPKIGRSWDCGKHQIRIFGPNELAMYSYMVDPVPGPMTDSAMERQLSPPSSHRGSPTRGEKKDLDTKDLNFSLIKSPKRNDAIYKTQMPAPSSYTSPVKDHARKPSYSLFPQHDVLPVPPMLGPPQFQQKTSDYDMTKLGLPQPTFARGSRNFRDSSESSATVQIGLRLSHAPSIDLADDEETLPLPATTYNARLASTPLPRYPRRSRSPPPLMSASPPPSPPLPSPLSLATLQPTIFAGFQRTVLPPVPLRVETSFISPSISARGGPGSMPTGSQFVEDVERASSPIKRSEPLAQGRNPSVSSDFLHAESGRESTLRLSPMVYKPQKNSSPLRKSPLSATVSNTGPNSLARLESKQDPSDQKGKADWI